MTMWIRKFKREDHGWPKYLPGGRIRTSTTVLAIAFIALFWVYQNYEPPPPAPVPSTQVVPPGFIPDPSYTWVPRTDVQRRMTTTTTTPTTTETTTETTSPTESTSPMESTSPGESPTSPTSPTTTTSAPTGATPVPSSPTPTPGQGPMSTPAAPTQ